MILWHLSLHTLPLYVLFFFGALMRHIRLYPLNLGVIEVVLEEMLTVGRNLDRNGQNPYLLTLLWFLLYLSWSCLTFCCSTLITLIFSTLRQDGLRDRRPKTKLKLFSIFKMLDDCSDDNAWFASLIDWNSVVGHLSMYHHKVMN